RLSVGNKQRRTAMTIYIVNGKGAVVETIENVTADEAGRVGTERGALLDLAGDDEADWTDELPGATPEVECAKYLDENGFGGSQGATRSGAVRCEGWLI